MRVHSQIISKQGLPIFVVLPYEEYEDILERFEEIEDVQSVMESEDDRSERFPLSLVEKIASGENPIKVFREYRKISQVELAKRMEVSRQYISQLESGARSGSPRVLKAIAKVLNVDFDDIT